MKHHVLPFLLFLFAVTLNAQSPQGLNYQAVVRDNAGITVADGTPVKLKFTIHDGTALGTPVYTETVNDTTNQFGLVNTVIGSSGNLATVSWGNGAKFLQVELQVNNAATFTDMGTTQLLSVPYALYAANSNPGPQGPTGNAGQNGLTGPTGDVGPTGAQGDAGPTGLQGDVGPTGPIGNTGAQGDPGLQGNTGLQGDVGPTGPQGLIGNTGPQGDPGLQGSAGSTGPQGDIGPTGPQGDPGLQGNTGVAGDAGATGPTGPAGSGANISVANVTASGAGPYVYTYTGSATPLFLVVTIATYGGGSCEGSVQVQWEDAGGGVIRSYTKISGTNIGNGNDGGSGMTDQELLTIPFLAGSSVLRFASAGCHNFSYNVISVIDK